MRIASLFICLLIMTSVGSEAKSKLPWWEFPHGKFVRTTGSVMVAVGARATQDSTGKIRLRARLLEYYFRMPKREEQSDRVYPQARTKRVGIFVYWEGKKLGVTSDRFGEYEVVTEIVPDSCWGTLEMGEKSATKLIKLDVRVEGCRSGKEAALREEVDDLRSQLAVLSSKFEGHTKEHVTSSHEHETLAMKAHTHIDNPADVGHPHDTTHAHPAMHDHPVLEIGQNETVSGLSSGRTKYIATYPISPPFLYVNKETASVRLLRSDPNDNLYGKVLEITEDSIKVGIYRDNNQFWTAGFKFRWQVSGKR